MRVVGGKWKSRKINQLLKNNHYSIIRPTTDRIRENMKSSGTVMFESTINKSINQSLSRTLITSLTSLLVIIVLLVYGGEVIRPFSFTMLVGVIIGTYSSIYIASALLATIYQNSK